MYAKSILAALAAPAMVAGQLHDLARAAGLEYFGTEAGEQAVNSDQQYRSIINNKSEWGQLVPENGQKWDSLQPSRGNFNYANGDIVPNVARQNGQLLRCHTLVWHSQLPGWVSNGSWNRQTLQQVIETHIANVMAHYIGQCYHWDVLNEAIDDNGSWRNSVFYRVFGTDYFAISFNAAKRADPNTKLYYNDYNLEYNQAKTNRAVELVNIVKAAGAPIDGVGFQGHLIVGTTPNRSQLATVLRRFTALGVDVAYTELDIRHENLPASSAANAQQGVDYANVVGSCLDVDRCVGVTVWGFTDKYSWIPGTFPGTGEALLYNSNFQKKAAWTSVSSVLAAAATGNPGNPTTTPITTPPITTTPVTTTPAPSPTGCTSPQWGQCGGNGWQGCTRCASGLTCQVINEWYYQCL